MNADQEKQKLTAVYTDEHESGKQKLTADFTRMNADQEKQVSPRRRGEDGNPKPLKHGGTE
jgi:hypothetical protein